MDTCGGFLVEDSYEPPTKIKCSGASTSYGGASCSAKPSDGDFICLDCGKPFPFSVLQERFDHLVCDRCKDFDEKHQLITRSDAKDEFLLKDCDLDLRPPPLRYIAKKNPHNPRWGDMKLYLRSQVESRALEIWDSLDALEEAREKRVNKAAKLKSKRFETKMKELRRTVTVDTTTVGTKASKERRHAHVFGPEQPHPTEEDVYVKRCKTCDHVTEFEKM